MIYFEQHINEVISRDNILPSSARPTPISYVVKKAYKGEYEELQFFYLGLSNPAKSVFHEPYWSVFDFATVIGYNDGLTTRVAMNERVANALRAHQPNEAYDRFKRALRQVVAGLPQKPQMKLYNGKSKGEQFTYLCWRMLQKG